MFNCLLLRPVVSFVHPYTRQVLLAGLLALAGLNGCSNSQPVAAQPAPEQPASGPVVEPPAPPATGPAPAFPGLDLTWTESVPSPVALYESQGLAANGRLYVFGGYHNKQIQASADSFAFDPATGRWFSLAPLPERVTHAGQALYKNKVYLAGGFVGDHPGPPTDHVWVYDLVADTWSPGPALPEPIGGGALVELAGRLHFFGGTVREGAVYLRDSPRHWLLDLRSGSWTWTDAAPATERRNHIAGVALDGSVYAVGGQRLGDEEAGNQRFVHAYNPVLNGWRRVADLPRPLGHISAATFAHGGRIVVVMGVTAGRAKTSDVVAYDPASDRWSSLKNMPGGRSATVAGVVGGEIVLSTGTVSGGPLDTTWVGTWDDD